MSNTTKQRKNKNTKSSLTPAQKSEVSILARRQIVKTSELKYLSFGNSYAGSLTWQFFSLTDVPQGTTDSSRVGDSLTPVSLKMKYQFDTSTAKAVPTEFFRVIVFQWFPNSVNLAPTGALMFQNDPYATVVNFRSNFSIDYQAKSAAQFRVLYDRTHCLVGYGTSTTWNPSLAGIIIANVSLASARKTVQFTAASTTDGAGKIYGGFIGTTSTNPVITVFNTEFHYRDS
jgi:hypothetical protein